jgi:hypothetical protein
LKELITWSPGVGRKKTLQIGEWNMDAVAAVNVAHGLGSNWNQIYHVSAIVRNDAGTTYYAIGNDDEAAGGLVGIQYTSTNINLSRSGSGTFDGTDFNATVSTVSSRGFITILYVA